MCEEAGKTGGCASFEIATGLSSRELPQRPSHCRGCQWLEDGLLWLSKSGRMILTMLAMFGRAAKLKESFKLVKAALHSTTNNREGINIYTIKGIFHDI